MEAGQVPGQVLEDDESVATRVWPEHHFKAALLAGVPVVGTDSKQLDAGSSPIARPCNMYSKDGCFESIAVAWHW